MSRVSEIKSGSPDLGSTVTLEGKVVELLPSFEVGDITYQRFLLADDTGSIVVLSSPPKNLLPGDIVRVEGRVRPCFFVPTERCVETSPSKIEVIDWKWISPSRRGEIRRLGRFDLIDLLRTSKWDEEVMRGVVQTSLEPVKIVGRIEEEVRSGGDLSHMIKLLTALVAYSTLKGDVELMREVVMTLHMVRGVKGLPDDAVRVVDSLLGIVEPALNRTLLSSYAKELEEKVLDPIIRYPTADQKDLEEMGREREIVELIMGKIEAGKGLVIVEAPDTLGLFAGRRCVMVAAGLRRARVRHFPFSVVMEATGSEKLGKFLLELLETGVVESEVPEVLFIEAIEVLMPSEMVLRTVMGLSGEGLEEAKAFIGNMTEVVKSVAQRRPVVLLIQSAVALSEKLVESAEVRTLGREREGRDFIPSQPI